MKILWCVTGAGHFLTECVLEFEEIAKKHEVTCLLSRAGREVVESYGLSERIRQLSQDCIKEQDQGASTPLSGSIRFHAAVIAPASANTCAKLAYGVADSAATNIASQFIKRKIHLVILPTDYEPEITTTLPNAKKVNVHCRRIDIENTETLKKEKGVTVITDPKKISSALPKNS